MREQIIPHFANTLYPPTDMIIASVTIHFLPLDTWKGEGAQKNRLKHPKMQIYPRSLSGWDSSGLVGWLTSKPMPLSLCTAERKHGRQLERKKELFEGESLLL